MDEDEALHLGLPHFTDPAWKELKHLFEKPWFRRMWVIQEVVLPRKLPLLVYGARARDFRHLLWSGMWINLRGLGDYLALYITHIEPLTTIFNIWNTKKPWNFQSLLIATRSFLVSDSRDRFYALLGLAAETQDETSYHPSIQPDYRKSAEQVYRDFTFYLISTSSDLVLLSMIHPPVTLTCEQKGVFWPSWVPKFKTNPTPYAGNFILDSGAHGRVQFKRYKINGAKDEPALMQESPEPNSLVLQGLKMEEVFWVSEAFQSSEEFLILRWCEEGARQLIPSKYPSFQGFLEQFLSLISGARGYTGGGMPSTDDFWEYLSDKGVHYHNLIYFLRFLKESSFDVAGDSATLTGLIMRIGASSFFITGKKAFGIGPRGIQTGDVISVLFGNQAPFVLRPCQGHYHLLGECFCIGLMKGEAVDKWKEDQIEPEWFTLK